MRSFNEGGGPRGASGADELGLSGSEDVGDWDGPLESKAALEGRGESREAGDADGPDSSVITGGSGFDIAGDEGERPAGLDGWSRKLRSFGSTTDAVERGARGWYGFVEGVERNSRSLGLATSPVLLFGLEM